MSGLILNVLDLYEYTRSHLKYTHQLNGTIYSFGSHTDSEIHSLVWNSHQLKKTLEIDNCADCEVCHQVGEATQGMVLL